MFIIQAAGGRVIENLTDEQIRNMIREGRLPHDAMARKAAQGDWRKLNTFPEFFAVVPNGAKPPPNSYSTPPFSVAAAKKTALAAERLTSTFYIRAMENGASVDKLYTGAEIVEMIHNGAISLRTLARKDGQQAWKEIGIHPEFVSLPPRGSRPPMRDLIDHANPSVFI